MNYLRFSLFFIGAITMVSCDPQSQKIELQNPTGQVKIEVIASRQNKLDGWMTQIIVRPFDRKETKLTTEFYFNELNSESFKIIWDSNYTAHISVIARNNTQRKFRLIATDELCHLYEMFNK